jgi:DNA topoisomerase-2
MNCLDDDIISLLARRAYDIAGCTPGVQVFLNEKKLPITKFEDYCNLYMSSDFSEYKNPIQLAYKKFGKKWEISVAYYVFNKSVL